MYFYMLLNALHLIVCPLLFTYLPIPAPLHSTPYAFLLAPWTLVYLIKYRELGQFMVPTKSKAATLHFIDLYTDCIQLFYVFN